MNRPYTIRWWAICALTALLPSVAFAFLPAAPGTGPVNDDCAGAIILTPGASCSPLLVDVDGATQSIPGISCGGFTGTADDDVWFAFTATATSHAIVVAGSANYDAVIDLRSGGCNGTNIACRDVEEAGGTETLVATGLSIGATYYIRVYDWFASAPTTTTFTICVIDPPGAPANDNCPGAIVLNPSLNCVPVAGSIASASQSIPAISCSGFTGTANDDVWYSFTATDASHTIEVTTFAGFDAVIDLREGACNGTNIACYDVGGTNSTEVMVANGLTIGATYYVRVYNWYATVPASTDFTICLIGTPSTGCTAAASTLTADADPVCFENGTASVSASDDGNASIPDGFEIYYLLSESGILSDSRVIPAFNVAAIGTYTVHSLVYDPNTMDVSTFVAGVTTISEIDAMLLQGGGTICGALNVNGTSINVLDCSCTANAGSLSTQTPEVCLVLDGPTTLSAFFALEPTIPSGFQLVFLLTSPPGATIQVVSPIADIEIGQVGSYAMHAFVYDPATFDLGSIDQGVTTMDELNSAFIQGGGSICASLDMDGATFEVAVCAVCEASAGTITANESPVCIVAGSAEIGATPDGNSNIPFGFTTVYLLTQGVGQVARELSFSPTFTVDVEDNYTVHTLVYDANTFQLSSITVGVTTAADLNAEFVQGGGSICASLDMTGAAIVVEICDPCPVSAGSLSADADPVCLEDGSADISATPNGDANVPPGFEVVYVLTQGAGLVIVDANSAPNFTVTSTDDYTIHTLVYDPNTLDLGAIEFGVTTGFDVNDLLIQGGGEICGSLDVNGAQVTVMVCVPCDAVAGTSTADETPVCLMNGQSQIGATPNGDAVVPDGFELAYFLSQGPGLVVVGVSTGPVFTVSEAGSFAIHALVYNPLEVDPNDIELGVSTIFEVDDFFATGWPLFCGSVDVTGAAIVVNDCSPANDDCDLSTPLPVNIEANCPANAVVGDNTYANMDGTVPDCDDAGSNLLDMWYTFNSGPNTSVTINLDQGTMEDWAVVVSDGCGGNDLLCVIQPLAPIDLTTDPNTEYVVRIYSNTTFGNGGQFTLCITGAEEVPVCDGAQVLTTNGATTVDVCQDTDADIIDFATTSISGENYTFLLADENNMIITPIAGGSLDFNSAPLGIYHVWGFGYSGDLVGADPGNLVETVTSTGSCYNLSDNFVLVNVEICSGINAIGGTSWNLFPNPNTGDINITYAGMDALTNVEIVDMGGRVIHQERVAMVQGQTHHFGLSGKLAQGMYTVRLTNTNGSAMLRMVVR